MLNRRTRPLETGRTLLAGGMVLLLSLSLAMVVPPEAQDTSLIRSDVAGSFSTKVHPTVVSALATDGPATRLWVFLSDRGSLDHAPALASLQETYPSRATRRRLLRRTAPGLFDERDLPVREAYVRAIEATGATVRVRSRWLNAVSVNATLDQIPHLAGLPWVEKIQPVLRLSRLKTLSPRTATPGPASPEEDQAGVFYGPAGPQIVQLNLVALHNEGFQGQGVLVGVLDTGFSRTHLAFANRNDPIDVIAEYDFVNDDANTAIEPGDSAFQHDHGTLVLGVMAANLPGTIVGGAYQASYILAKVESLDFENTSEEDFFVAGLEWLEANGADLATSSVVIFNTYTQDQLDGLTAVMSLGVKAAVENGIHFFQAAGNEGHDADPATNRLIPPADGINANTVGAVTSAGVIASFSSDGPSADGRVKPEILAWGQNTVMPDSFSNQLIISASGTSFASPLACAAAACIVQKHPEWTPRQLRSAMYQTASFYQAFSEFDPQYVYGYGILNAHAASMADPKLADLNEDFRVGIEDFLLVLAQWGACGTCPADMDGDGMVGITEFLRVLAEWG